MTLHRIFEAQKPEENGQEERPLSLDAWLDDKQSEYDMLVARLRYVDEVLVRHGRKRNFDTTKGTKIN